jgi:hypothetical protein
MTPEASGRHSRPDKSCDMNMGSKVQSTVRILTVGQVGNLRRIGNPPVVRGAIREKKGGNRGSASPYPGISKKEERSVVAIVSNLLTSDAHFAEYTHLQGHLALEKNWALGDFRSRALEVAERTLDTVIRTRTLGQVALDAPDASWS